MLYPHWQYFLTLDSEMDRITRYVEIGPNNYKTYSIQFVHLLLATCSEVDVVCKVLCKKANPSEKPENIHQYQQILTAHYPGLHSVRVTVPRHGKMILVPWGRWGKGSNPDWWSIHNKVKHQRHEYFRQANLRNTVNALAGLFVLICYLYKGEINQKQELPTWPKILSLPEQYINGHVFKDTFSLRLP